MVSIIYVNNKKHQNKTFKVPCSFKRDKIRWDVYREDDRRFQYMTINENSKGRYVTSSYFGGRVYIKEIIE